MTGIIFIDILLTSAAVGVGFIVAILLTELFGFVRNNRREKEYKNQKSAIKNAFRELDREDRT